MSGKISIRFAQPGDEGLILEFIRGLAEYEKMEADVVATEELLKEWIFEKQKAEVLFAVADGQEVGFALFFHNFSTFLGRAGIYLEDLGNRTQISTAVGYDYMHPQIYPDNSTFALFKRR